MHHNHLMFFFFVLILAIGCRPNGQGGGGTEEGEEQPAPTLAFEQREFSRQSPSCEQDSNYCALIKADYPLAVAGPEEVVKRVNDTLQSYLKVSLAVFASSPEDTQKQSIEEIADNFLKEFETANSEEGGGENNWQVEVSGEPLFQSKEVVSVQLTTDAYVGGAHPNSFVYLINFNTRTGEVLLLPDLVSDTARLLELAEVAFREARELGPDESLSEAGFFWGDAFALPENYAITEEGLYFFYNPYEVAAYVFGPTEFTIERDKLSGILKEL